ncbi:unnamed protein product [Brassica oleracea]
MEDKGKGLAGEDEENSLSVSERGPSNMEMEVDGSDDNYDDDEDENSDEGCQVDDDDDDDDDDEGDESEAVSVIPTTFERLEYEALAEKKRKALFDSQRDGSEKRGKYDAKELVFTGRRRRRRKQSDYVSKAVQADPEDIDLKYEYADLCLSAGIYKEAAETYEKIFRRHPEIIEPLKRGTEYFLKSGKGERAANMLEDHIKSHPSEVGPDILDLLADVLMQINAYDRALKYIHDVRQIYNLGKELPSSLKIRQAICHVRLEEMEQAEIVLNILPREAVSEHPKLIIDLADELTNIENFHSALKYYLLAINDTLNNGYLLVKAARCYMSLEKREQA